MIITKKQVPLGLVAIIYESMLQVGDGMRDMNDSIIYADPDFYYDGSADSTMHHDMADPSVQGVQTQGGDVDEFEVVTGPE